jgi:tRNA(Ile)-lysidine synthase
MPSTEQLEQVHNQLNAQINKVPSIKVGRSWLRRFKDELHLTADFEDVSAWRQKIEVQHDSGLQKVELPDQLGTLAFDVGSFDKVIDTPQDKLLMHQHIAPPTKHQKVWIRFSHQNPKCLPEYRQHSRPLKKVLQELSIAPWQRKRLPFIYYDEQLVAVAGHFVCKQYIPAKNETTLNIFWFESKIKRP